MSFLRRWWQLIVERFSPWVYIPTVGVFVVANTVVATHNMAGTTEALELHALAVIVTSLITLSFFFRLRIFDEIKDLEVDRTLNPTRPFARGLIQVAEARGVLAALTVFELTLCLGLGAVAGGPFSPDPIVAHLVAVLYSYAMYNEFGIGRYLRPHLTTYAVTHTFVSVLLSTSVMAQVTGAALTELPLQLYVLGLVNWMLFNVFEFARKSYAPSEERDSVDTYSSLFTPLGAWALTTSQIALAVALLWWFQTGLLSVAGLWTQAGLALALVCVGLCYGLRKSVVTSKLYRHGASAYLLVFYAVFIADAALT